MCKLADSVTSLLLYNFQRPFIAAGTLMNSALNPINEMFHRNKADDLYSFKVDKRRLGESFRRNRLLPVDFVFTHEFA